MFKPSHYTSFDQMKHSHHWHCQRVGEVFFNHHLPIAEWDALMSEFYECGMMDNRVIDQYGVDWKFFMQDYAAWVKSGVAY